MRLHENLERYKQMLGFLWHVLETVLVVALAVFVATGIVDGIRLITGLLIVLAVIGIAWSWGELTRA